MNISCKKINFTQKLA